MATRSDNTDYHPTGGATEHVAKHASSKTDSSASTHHLHNTEETKGDKVDIRYHQANPGPVIPGEIDAQQEGTKEERMAKAKELNK
jgi:hypothetical protein